jgi:(p)ppGpp synthase/HD superfamily hydrolase
MYAARIVAEAWDRPGLISDLTTVLALASINLVEISSGKHQDRKVFISLTLETIGGEEFTSVLSSLEQVRGIVAIQRQD